MENSYFSGENGKKLLSDSIIVLDSDVSKNEIKKLN